MIIQDKTKEQRKSLDTEYKRKIDDSQNKAQKTRREILRNHRKSAQVSGQKFGREMDKKASAERQTLLGAKRLELMQHIMKIKEEFVQDVLAEVRKEIESQDIKTKKKLVHAMYRDVKDKAKRSGVRSFTYHVWKGISLPGTQADLDSLAVIAESQTVTIEDSLQQRIEGMRDRIVRMALDKTQFEKKEQKAKKVVQK